VPVGPVRTVVQAAESRGTAARDMAWQVPDPLLGAVPLVASPMKPDRTPPVARQHPPLLGEHTAEVVGELGYAGGDVAQLVADRVVVTRRPCVAAPPGRARPQARQGSPYDAAVLPSLPLLAAGAQQRSSADPRPRG
jgi:hypothetical protein